MPNIKKSMELANKRLILGLTGGIACYKSAELTRLLRATGTSVQVVMTDAATQFITPITMQALSGQRVYTGASDISASDVYIANDIADPMAHIHLSRIADAIIIAPASANFIAKLAHGMADDLLSTLCTARTCPLIVVPAMNVQMWQNPAMQRNIAQLHADGVVILGPATGAQACGETGEGRMLEPGVIVEAVTAFFQPKLLQRKRILLTAGPTFEPIDPVRGLTNLSSGKMGFALARAAAESGAQVKLIAGPTALATPWGVQRENVQTAQQMTEAVMAAIADADADADIDIFISVAAVTDWRANKVGMEKIKKESGGSKNSKNAGPQFTLVETPDILAMVSGLPHPPFCVGFAVESDHLEKYGQEKRKRKKVPLLVGNSPAAFGSEDNELILFDETGITRLPRANKQVLARMLIAEIAQRLGAMCVSQI